MIRAELVHQLADLINAVQRPHTVRVAIDGVDASGKTILANELVGPLEAKGRPVIRASIDGFHNPRSVRYRRGPDSPEGYYHDSFNYDLLKASLLIPLGPTGDGQYALAAFDFRTDTEVASGGKQAPDGAVLLFDGVFLLRPELRDHWDYSLFVDVDFEVSVERASRRDQYLFGSVDDVRVRYLARYVPGQQLYLQEVQPLGKSDVIVKNNIPEEATIVE